MYNSITQFGQISQISKPAGSKLYSAVLTVGNGQILLDLPENCNEVIEQYEGQFVTVIGYLTNDKNTFSIDVKHIACSKSASVPSKVILLGRLGSKPSPTILQSAKTVLKVSIATSSYSPKEKAKVTSWFNLSIWDKKAEIVTNYLDKGSLVMVEGYLKHESYKSKKGEEVNTFNVTVTDVILLPKGNQVPTEVTTAPVNQTVQTVAASAIF